MAQLRVVIGCRLPHGLEITHPNPEDGRKITLAGYHSNRLVTRSGEPAQLFATTDVDADLWDAWKIAYRNYKPLQQGLVYEARTEQEAAQKFKSEFRKAKTGFESLDKAAHGVKEADKD